LNHLYRMNVKVRRRIQTCGNHLRFFSMESRMLRFVTGIGMLVTAMAAQTSVLAGESAASELKGKQWAVIYSPAYPTGFPSDEPFRDGADEFHKRLIQSGVEQQQIKVITGKNATRSRLESAIDEVASSLNADDVFMVYVGGFGIHRAGKDFLATAETNINEVLQTGGNTAAENSLIEIEHLISLMATAPTKRQCLMIDSISDLSSQINGSSGQNFGTQPIQQLEDQNVIMSRSGQMWNRGPNASAAGAPRVTLFNRSILDAMSGYADADSNNELSLFELISYVQLYARTADANLPLVVGGNQETFTLTNVPRMDATDSEARKQRQHQTRFMIELSQKTLLLEKDLEATEVALKHAARLCDNDETRHEIRRLMQTVLVAKGDFKAAWQEASQQSSPALFVFVNNGIDVSADGKVIGRIDGDCLLQIDRTHADQWAHPVDCLRLELRNGVMQWTRTTFPNGWVFTSALKQSTPTDTALAVNLDQLFPDTTP
jgi:hypothetical protein